MTQFAIDKTPSNMAGVTLMNNQVGHVVAEVMKGKPGVTLIELADGISVEQVRKSTEASLTVKTGLH